MLKKVSVLTLCVLWLGILASTVLAQDMGDSSRFGGVLKAAVVSNPTSPDPHRVTQTAVRVFAVMIYESLFAFNENYVPQPQLASTWEVSPDGLEWVIHLRQGVLFHNGEEMTAEDVKASLDRYRTYGALKEGVSYIQSIGIVDNYTVKLKLDDAIRSVPGDLANPLSLPAIFPKEIIEDRSDEISPEEAIGTGPYKLVSWKPDVEFRFARFEDYVPDTRQERSGLAGWKKAYFDEIVLIPQPEEAARMAGLETGIYDFIESVPLRSYQRLLDNPELQALVVKPLVGIYPELNKSEPPMDNVYFRRAVLTAIDCEEVMKAVTMGNKDFYRLQPCIFFPEQADLWTNAGEEYYNVGNVELARELLDKAGYAGEEIVYLSNTNYPDHYRTSLAVAQQLIAAGINIRLQFQDWPAQLDIMRSLEGWHIAQSSWSLRFSPAPLASSLCAGAINSYGYQNPEPCSLIEEYKMAMDEERPGIIDTLMTTFYEDVPHIRIGDRFGLWGARSGIRGMKAWYLPTFFNVWRQTSE